MSVRAKFRVQSITSQIGTIRNDDGSYSSGVVKTVKMNPTYDSDPASENGKFWAASPGGELSLNIVNPKAVETFELGKDYYLDFTPAE